MAEGAFYGWPWYYIGAHPDPRHAGQRLDLIANYFLKDATTSWQLCDANDAVVPDALAVRNLIGIPPTGQ